MPIFKSERKSPPRVGVAAMRSSSRRVSRARVRILRARVLIRVVRLSTWVTTFADRLSQPELISCGFSRRHADQIRAKAAIEAWRKCFSDPRESALTRGQIFYSSVLSRDVEMSINPTAHARQELRPAQLRPANAGIVNNCCRRLSGGKLQIG